MKLRRVPELLLAITVVALGTAFGQGSYKAAAIGAPPAAVPPALAAALDAQGTSVTNAQGATLCEVWLRKDLPASANPNTSSDVMFGTLPEGSFVGVVHFPAASSDFRSQTIKPGFYTIRYGLIPQDGNHMGVNPTRDAFVLGPVVADPGPDKVLSFDDMVKLSRQASGTNHPQFLIGAQPAGNEFPSVSKDDAGNWDLQLQGHSKGGNLPIGFTVVGHWQG